MSKKTVRNTMIVCGIVAVCIMSMLPTHWPESHYDKCYDSKTGEVLSSRYCTGYLEVDE